MYKKYFFQQKNPQILAFCIYISKGTELQRSRAYRRSEQSADNKPFKCLYFRKSFLVKYKISIRVYLIDKFVFHNKRIESILC